MGSETKYVLLNQILDLIDDTEIRELIEDLENYLRDIDLRKEEDDLCG
jgi:uncharacterized membrane protein|tara:strand:+ start:2305 stop:2448 length:144 start_codon:yes stop_codon:yes gene_type:complete